MTREVLKIVWRYRLDQVTTRICFLWPLNPRQSCSHFLEAFLGEIMCEFIISVVRFSFFFGEIFAGVL